MNKTSDGGDAGAEFKQAAATRDDENLDFDEGLRELSELATGQLPLLVMLTKVAEYAVRAIPGAEGAGLTLIADDRSETLVSTTQLVTDVDAIQYGLRQGPCITAAAQGKAVWSRSLGEDQRWPVFGPQVARLGVHSALSLPLITPNRVVGAMNIYARQKDTFDERAAKLGQLYAVPAAIAVQNAQVLNGARTLAVRLQQALNSQAVIDRAIGVLIGRDKISAATAEAWLRLHSEAQGMTLLEVAAETVRQAARRGPGQDTPSGLA